VCPICGSNVLYKNGHTIKIVKHCTYYTSLFLVKCYIQNYKCKECNHTFREKNTFANENEQLSKEIIFVILDKLKYHTATFESVARDLHLNRHTVMNVFDKYVEYIPSSTLPEIMCFDEKHINKGYKTVYIKL
jgi:transposase